MLYWCKDSCLFLHRRGFLPLAALAAGCVTGWQSSVANYLGVFCIQHHLFLFHFLIWSDTVGCRKKRNQCFVPSGNFPSGLKVPGSDSRSPFKVLVTHHLPQHMQWHEWFCFDVNWKSFTETHLLKFYIIFNQMAKAISFSPGKPEETVVTTSCCQIKMLHQTHAKSIIIKGWTIKSLVT